MEQKRFKKQLKEFESLGYYRKEKGLEKTTKIEENESEKEEMKKTKKKKRSGSTKREKRKVKSRSKSKPKIKTQDKKSSKFQK